MLGYKGREGNWIIYIMEQSVHPTRRPPYCALFFPITQRQTLPLFSNNNQQRTSLHYSITNLVQKTKKVHNSLSRQSQYPKVGLKK